MPKAWLSELGAKLPQIALAMLAAKRGGPEASAAFMSGLQESADRRQVVARQAQLDEERRGAQAQELAYRQRQEARQGQQDVRQGQQDARGVEQEAYARRIAAVNYLARLRPELEASAPDALGGEQEFSRQAAMQEQIGGMEPGSLMAMTPSLSKGISRRKAESARLWAQRIVEDAREASVKLGQPLTDESVSMDWAAVPSYVQEMALAQGHPTGEDGKPLPLKLGQFEQLAQLSTFRTAGKAADTPATIDRAILSADQRGDEREVQRLVRLKAQIEAAGRAPTQGPAADTARSWVLRDGKAVRVREGDILPGDTPYTAPRNTSDTAQDRQRKGRLDAARGFLTRLNELREKINTKMGPEAGLTGLARQGLAGVGMDPDVAEYERVRAAGGRSLAVAIMGAQNLSDADANAWANMLPGSRVDAVTAKRLTDQVGRMLEETESEAPQIKVAPGAPSAGTPRADPLGIRR